MAEPISRTWRGIVPRNWNTQVVILRMYITMSRATLRRSQAAIRATRPPTDGGMTRHRSHITDAASRIGVRSRRPFVFELMLPSQAILCDGCSIPDTELTSLEHPLDRVFHYVFATLISMASHLEAQSLT